MPSIGVIVIIVGALLVPQLLFVSTVRRVPEEEGNGGAVTVGVASVA